MRIETSLRVVRLFAATVLLALSAAAQFPATETSPLSAGLGEFAGLSVALSGDVAFVGAPSEQFLGQSRYVFAYRLVAGQWTLEQTLLPDPLDDGRFGYSLDFDGTTLVVGSPPVPKGGHGRATVFTFNGTSWVGTALAYPPSNEPAISYGTSVAVDGDSILIGAPLTDVGLIGQSGEDVGSAFGYRRTAAGTWQLKQQVKPSSPVHGLAFGIALDIAGHRALIGTVKDRVHAFRFAFGTQWSETSVLTPSLATPVSSFGQAIAVSGDRAAIGAFLDHSLPNTGAAFVFERSCEQWIELQRLDAPANGALFGRTVGIGGDVVIVGAPYQAVLGNDSAGAAYAYRWDGASYGLEQELHAAVPAANAKLGIGLAVSGDRALLGTSTFMAADVAGLVFDATPVASPWTDLGFALAGGSLPHLHGTGTLQPASPLELTVECGPPGAAGVLFAGLAALQAPFKGGVLVPLPLISAGVALDGGGHLALPATWPSGVPAGTNLLLQAWLVDAGGPAGLSASNGLRATAMP